MFVLNYTITRAHVARAQKFVPHRFWKPNRASTWPSRIAIWIAAFLVSASLTMMFPTFVGKFANQSRDAFGNPF